MLRRPISERPRASARLSKDPRRVEKDDACDADRHARQELAEHKLGSARIEILEPDARLVTCHNHTCGTDHHVKAAVAGRQTSGAPRGPSGAA